MAALELAVPVRWPPQKERNRGLVGPTDHHMPIDTILAFSQNKASRQQLHRALVSHDEWFVPLQWAVTVLRRETGLQVIGDRYVRYDDDYLAICTSRAAVLDAQARGGQGVFVGPIPGVELFASFPDDHEYIDINRGLDKTVSLLVEGEAAIHDLRELARAVALERAFDRSAPDLPRRLREHDFFMYVSPTNGLAKHSEQLPFALAFTSRDAAALVEHMLPGWKLIVVRGEELLPSADRLRVPGFILNAHGPGDTIRVIPVEMCRQLAAA